ncbi:hypothetical protein AB1Y20_006176 [Prymnesium parvum]|uniref:C-type lectin domain-containing protein n=1 Tax=Prymnesium parvum TaxID=97485 RepID=A0AB34J1Y0_PRYPA
MVRQPVKLILDTDMGGGDCDDVDDVGTLCMLNALMDNGEVELLAVVINTMPQKIAGVVSVLQHFYGRDDVLIGAYKGGSPWYWQVSAYVGLLADHWPSPLKHTSQLPSALEVYRRTLASQPDHSVVISSVGMLTNLADLIRSQPDTHSPLSGLALFTSKVRLLAVMGGAYPQGFECNFCASRDDAAFVFAHLPPKVPVLYLGVEIGLEVMHGAALTDCADRSNPCRQAYIDYLRGPHRDRPSWDPLTTLAAVRGIRAVPGLLECQGGACRGFNRFDSDSCANEWQARVHSNQTYLRLDRSKADAAGAAIDRLVCQPRRAEVVARREPPYRQEESPPWQWRPTEAYELYVSRQEARDFAQAEHACVDLGGHLAAPWNAARNERVRKAMVAHGHESVLLGARSDIVSEDGDFFWVGSHERVEYSNWAEGQPDRARWKVDGDWKEERCVEMWRNGKWNDCPCDGRHYVCDIPTSPPPDVPPLPPRSHPAAPPLPPPLAPPPPPPAPPLPHSPLAPPPPSPPPSSSVLQASSSPPSPCSALLHAAPSTPSTTALSLTASVRAAAEQLEPLFPAEHPLLTMALLLVCCGAGFVGRNSFRAGRLSAFPRKAQARYKQGASKLQSEDDQLS